MTLKKTFLCPLDAQQLATIPSSIVNKPPMFSIYLKQMEILKQMKHLKTVGSHVLSEGREMIVTVNQLQMKFRQKKFRQMKFAK